MTTLQQQFTRTHLHLFVSYARADKEALRAVVEGLETLHHEIWIDHKLDVGQAWWDEILSQIRSCDAMIIAVSPALLESDAATKEREYARQLGKPLLPILVAPLLTDLLPPDLAPVQLVDLTNIGPLTGFQLAGALAALPPVSSLPDPLPPPPSVPVSYLSGVADRVRAPAMSLEEQLALVAVLRVALDRPREREAAVELLQALQHRRDLYYATWQELGKLLPPDALVEGGDPPPLSTAAAPGWYPDPSGRHQLRWFDGDWTEYASDFGTVIADPDF